MKRILYFLLFFSLHACLGYAQVLDGAWKGDLKFGESVLPFVIHLQDTPAGVKAWADSPKQGVFNIPATAKIKGDSIFITVQGGIRVQGMFRKQDTMEATFYQGAVQLPLTLVRGNAERSTAVPVLPRPQEPQLPYPYDTLAVTFKNSIDGLNLAGTLTFPKGGGKHPAVILITGSGPQNREEEFFGHKPFKVLADYLTRQGIVVLRYDDRGVGKSEGNFQKSTIEHFSKDAMAAFTFLVNQPMVDYNKVGIIGHSEGGLIANLLAGQGLSHLSFIVSLAGPAIPIDKLMVQQLYAVGKAAGMSETQRAAAAKINARNFAIVKGNLPVDEAYKAIMTNMVDSAGIKPNTDVEVEMMTMLAPAYRYFMRINPEPFIRKIHIPVFAAYGSLDIQVPADSNLKNLFDLLPKNEKTVLKEYDGKNHLFQSAKKGTLDEYSQLTETMSPEVMHDIAQWIIGL